MKPYEAHEIAYQRMREQGVQQWGGKGSGTKGAFGREIKSFLTDVLGQPWAPKDGRVIELGCGTGPILRWVCKQGFSGVGLDVSKTAIAMAKEQSEGLDIRFRRADVCDLGTVRLGKFDLVVDGHCYHCITAPADRKAFLETARILLKPGGMFILMSMCTPLDKQYRREALKGYILHKKVVYQPFEKDGYEKIRIFNGKPYLPGRYLDHWKNILTQMYQAGFDIKLMRYNAASYKDSIGTLIVGAVGR